MRSRGLPIPPWYRTVPIAGRTPPHVTYFADTDRYPPSEQRPAADWNDVSARRSGAPGLGSRLVRRSGSGHPGAIDRRKGECVRLFEARRSTYETEKHMRIRALFATAVAAALALGGAASPAHASSGVADDARAEGATVVSTSNAGANHERELIGALHEHSGYSDGWPGSTPTSYFESGRDTHNLGFVGSSEHPSNVNSPFVFNEECLDPRVAPLCQNADPAHPLNALRKWDATLEQAKAATDPAKDFVGFRGVEGTSDRMGHINVYFSRENSLPETDGGTIAMDRFYDWLTTTGKDGLAVFNHPGDKTLCGPLHCDVRSDLGFGWEDFKYFPEADDQMVGIEVFNGGGDFGTPPGHNAPPEGWYARALDKGWHVGAIGAEDNGHQRDDDWGGTQYAKTVVLAKSNTEKDIKKAMADRRFYAVLDNALRLDFTIDGHEMGERIHANGKHPL